MDILVLEDDPFLQIDMEDVLTEAGHSVVGPFSRLSPALDAVRDRHLDFAFIDFNLGDSETSAPVADTLVEHGVRFVFVTGHASDFIPKRFKHVGILGKPYRSAEIIRIIEAAA